MGITVELQTVEDSHDADVLHAAVLHDGIEDNLSVGIDILQLVPRYRLQKLRDGEDGTGAEPAADMVARDVVEHGVVGHLEDVVLQLLQCRDACHLGFRLGVTEHEVTEAHVLLDELAQIDVHLLRVLIDEAEMLRLRLLLVLYLGTL